MVFLPARLRHKARSTALVAAPSPRSSRGEGKTISATDSKGEGLPLTRPVLVEPEFHALSPRRAGRGRSNWHRVRSDRPARRRVAALIPLIDMSSTLAASMFSDPAGFQILRQGLSRIDAHDIEPQRLTAAYLIAHEGSSRMGGSAECLSRCIVRRLLSHHLEVRVAEREPDGKVGEQSGAAGLVTVRSRRTADRLRCHRRCGPRRRQPQRQCGTHRRSAHPEGQSRRSGHRQVE